MTPPTAFWPGPWPPATAALLTSAIGSVLIGGVRPALRLSKGFASSATVAAGGIVAAGPMSSMERGPMAYFVDSLFRRNAGVEAAQMPERTMATMANEAAGWGASSRTSAAPEPLPPEDIQYVGRSSLLNAPACNTTPRNVSPTSTRAQVRLNDAGSCRQIQRRQGAQGVGLRGAVDFRLIAQWRLRRQPGRHLRWPAARCLSIHFR